MISLSCAAVRRRVPAFHDGELSIEAQIAVETHLEFCPACAAELRRLRLLRETLRSAAGTLSEGSAEDLGGLPGAVTSRLTAERDGSLPSRIGRLFEDMHLVWAAVGATGATAASAAIILGMMQLGPREQRPDSLAAILAAMASSGSNHNPARVDGRMLLPRAYADAVMPAVVMYHGGGPENDEPAFALAAVVTREGAVTQLEVLPPAEPVVNDARLGSTTPRHDPRLMLALLEAASTARFEPARFAGAPVAVNMIWLLAHTTVRGKAQGDPFARPRAPRPRPEVIRVIGA